jgi:SSS family solute:Na+ symporter
MGMGFAFKYLFNIPPLLGIFLSLCVVLVYVSIGGYSASMWVNTLQGALIALVFLISPFIVFSYTDWDIIEKAAMGVSGNYLSMMRLGLIWGLGMLIMGGVGYTNCPHVAQKWLTVKDPKLLKKAAVIDTIGSMACYFPGTLLGLTARIFFPTPDMLTGGIKDMAFFDVVGVIAPNPIFSGILVITMFAAMMSTADSMILTSSQAITYDFVAKVLGVKWNQRKINIFNRIITVLVGLAAFAIGIYTKWMLFYVGTFGWAGLGAALGLPLLFALYWRGTTKYGAIAGMISGLVATMAWGLSPLKKIVHEGGPGTIITIVVIVAVSLLTSSQEEKKKADEIIAMAKH